MMIHLNGYNCNPIYFEGIIADLIHYHSRRPGVLMVRKYVRKFGLKLIDDGWCSIYGDICFLQKIERAYIVHPSRVVFMLVGENQRIQPVDAFPQHLVPKIGTRINHKTLSADGYVNGCSQSLVPKIHRLANPARTAYHRYTLGGACTKKSNSQSFNSVCCNSVKNSRDFLFSNDLGFS